MGGGASARGWTICQPRGETGEREHGQLLVSNRAATFARQDLPRKGCYRPRSERTSIVISRSRSSVTCLHSQGRHRPPMQSLFWLSPPNFSVRSPGGLLASAYVRGARASQIPYEPRSGALTTRDPRPVRQVRPAAPEASRCRSPTARHRFGCTAVVRRARGGIDVGARFSRGWAGISGPGARACDSRFGLGG